MRKILMAIAVIVALGCPALAGEIHIPVAAPPTGRTAQTADGETHNGLTETVLTLFESMLALF